MGIKYLSLSEATVLSFTTPIFVAIIQAIFQNIKLRRIDIICLIFCAIGVILIVQPESLVNLVKGSKEA